jgi:hypothetical protein
MAEPISADQDITPIPGTRRRAGVIAGASGAALLAVLLLISAVLWLRYGTAVFFEMIASGFAACF